MITQRTVAAATALLFCCALSAQQHRARTTALLSRLGKLASTVPIAVAHRGASADFPENTLPAFRAAVQDGATMVELDFRQTSDGVLVCLHDRTLDRTTDCESKLKRKQVRVDSITLAELRRLDAGKWKNRRFAGTRIPTLEEALRAIQKHCTTMIEHKAGDPETLVKLLRKMDLVDDVLVQSFDWKFLERVHRLEPKLAIAALGSKELDSDMLRAAHRTGAGMLHWSGARLTIEQVQQAHKLGYLVCAYTFDSDVEFLGAAAIALDAITTNRPGRLRTLTARGLVKRARAR